MRVYEIFGIYILLFCSLFSIATSSENVTATDPFNPCDSLDTPTGLSVFCDRVSINTVKTIFNKVKTPVYIDELFLEPSSKDSIIVANVIGSHTIGTIYLICPIRKTNPLIIDPAAFTSSKLVTTTLIIDNCDLGKIDWSFLRGFSNLTILNIQYSSNAHTKFYTLPTLTLPKLKFVYFLSVMGLNGFSSKTLKFPSPLPNGLSGFEVRSSYDASDDAFQNILEKWIIPTSRKTLTTLKLFENTLSKIPIAVSKLNALNNAWFFGNAKTLNILPGTFNLTGPIQMLGLAGSKITSIAPGVFSGNFQDALVFMANNKLTTLNSAAFLTMLQQMDSSSGFLDVSFNPLDCSPSNICNMSWLIRDNQKLLENVWSARCSNGTFFYELNADDLRDPDDNLCD